MTQNNAEYIKNIRLVVLSLLCLVMLNVMYMCMYLYKYVLLNVTYMPSTEHKKFLVRTTCRGTKRDVISIYVIARYQRTIYSGLL